ncbi:class I SAM-dependent methyltransferase [Allorhizocola rhizosphaerae]|uniref:class I SAM-dependent methyltransferase n=1 Tax=Allorhizocola rhizosphaerae TaxID=1872709 RepID=UPI001FE6FFCE|nr:50S ribosomal protein L11 methyltransferase [Allorhizocola rhizosphaerae]
MTFLSAIKLHLAEEVIPIWEDSERDAPPFWAFAWAGGQALARYVMDHPELVRGRRVLDLASGSGLVAIAAALSDAALVIANEIDGYAIEAIHLNAAANNVAVGVHDGNLLFPAIAPIDVDVILAGDVFYSRDMSEQVLAFLARERTADIYVGDPGRAYAPKTGFEAVAEYDVPVNEDVESTPTKHTRILRFSHSPRPLPRRS